MQCGKEKSPNLDPTTMWCEAVTLSDCGSFYCKRGHRHKTSESSSLMDPVSTVVQLHPRRLCWFHHIFSIRISEVKCVFPTALSSFHRTQCLIKKTRWDAMNDPERNELSRKHTHTNMQKHKTHTYCNITHSYTRFIKIPHPIQNTLGLTVIKSTYTHFVFIIKVLSCPKTYGENVTHDFQMLQ